MTDIKFIIIHLINTVYITVSINNKKMTNRTTLILTLTILILTLLSFQTQIQNVNAKEIEATHEWQIVQEGDTIPAGLHVKMDLETGAKWVKLLDDGDNHDHGDTGDTSKDHSLSLHHLNNSQVNDRNNQNNVKITQLSNQEQKISPDIASKIQSQLLKQAQEEQIRKRNMIESVAKLNDFNGDMSINEADYEMIYRTLMSLPEEDRATLNIPIHPNDVDNDDEKGRMSENKEKELQEFSKKMKEIWSQRQIILKQLEEQYLANIPDIIRDRIIFIQKYVTSPIKYLKDVMNHQSSNNNDNSVDDGSKSTMSIDIIQTLEDLEYDLMDLDMTRDFYTMGGWPLLVSLLSDEIHGLDGVVNEIIHTQNWTETEYNNNPNTIMKLSNEDQLYIENLQEIIWNVQTLASWCIGTAVKNVHEFHPWALEDLSHFLRRHDETDTDAGDVDDLEKKDTNVNVISILLSKYATDKNMLIKSSITESLTPTWLKMKQKEIYALGALLRGNKDAIIYFHSMNGPQILSLFFNDIIVSNQSAIWDNKDGVKLLLKIMMLGVDLIAELGSQNENGDLLSSLTDDIWCSMPMKILMNSATTTRIIQRQALEGMSDMIPHCSFDQDTLVQMMKTINVDDTEMNGLFNGIIEKIGETK